MEPLSPFLVKAKGMIEAAGALVHAKSGKSAAEAYGITSVAAFSQDLSVVERVPAGVDVMEHIAPYAGTVLTEGMTRREPPKEAKERSTDEDAARVMRRVMLHGVTKEPGIVLFGYSVAPTHADLLDPAYFRLWPVTKIGHVLPSPWRYYNQVARLPTLTATEAATLVSLGDGLVGPAIDVRYFLKRYGNIAAAANLKQKKQQPVEKKKKKEESSGDDDDDDDDGEEEEDEEEEDDAPTRKRKHSGRDSGGHGGKRPRLAEPPLHYTALDVLRDLGLEHMWPEPDTPEAMRVAECKQYMRRSYALMNAYWKDLAEGRGRSEDCILWKTSTRDPQEAQILRDRNALFHPCIVRSLVS